MKISEFQKLIRDLYLEKDRKRGLERTFFWFVEEVGELAEAIRKGENVGEEIADVFAWLVSLANILEIDVESEVKKKYPYKCLKCNKIPCECEENVSRS